MVTRARHQASETCRLLECRGAIAIAMPTIEIRSPADFGPVLRAVERIDGYDRLILSSANAVAPLASALAQCGLEVAALAGVQVCAVGPGTADALRDIGLTAHVVAEDHRGEGLLAVLTRRPVRGTTVAGERVLMLRAAKARDVVPVGLEAQGAAVDVVVAYQTVMPAASAWTPGLEALRAGKVDGLLLTSTSTARNFATICGDDLVGLLDGVVVAAIGSVTADACRQVGMTVDVEPRQQTIPALVDAVEAHFGDGG